MSFVYVYEHVKNLKFEKSESGFQISNLKYRTNQIQIREKSKIECQKQRLDKRKKKEIFEHLKTDE